MKKVSVHQITEAQGRLGFGKPNLVMSRHSVGDFRKLLIELLAGALVLGFLSVPQRIAHAEIVPIGPISDDLTTADFEYSKYYYGAARVKSGFNGNVATCDAGQTSQKYKDAYTQGVNYMRSLAGIDGLSYDPQTTEEAQQAALMMDANSNAKYAFWSYYRPPRDSKCGSDSGANALANSNVDYHGKGNDYVGYTLENYLSIVDIENINVVVWNRYWLLEQNLTRFSVGSTKNANVFDHSSGLDWSHFHGEQRAVAWPSAGYFPSALIPDSNQWSFVTSVKNADYSKVKITMRKNNKAIDNSQIRIVTIPTSEQDSLPREGVVWELSGFTKPKGDKVDKWTVEISGIYDAQQGAFIDSKYDVLVFEPTKNLPAPVGLKIDHPDLSTSDVVEPFVDLTKNKSRNADINWLAATGVTAGCKHKNQIYYYCPESPVTRGSMAEFLYRLSGSPVLSSVPNSYFQDLDKVNSDRKRAIDWLYAAKITTGCTKINFCPGSIINRGAMAEFLYRFAGSPEINNSLEPIVDISGLNSARQKAIRWMASEKITILDNHKYFPSSPVNRGAMAQFLHRLYDWVADSQLKLAANS